MGCYFPLGSANVRCRKCGIPLCDFKCETSKFHQLECNYLSQKERTLSDKEDLKDLNLVTLLRAAIIKETDPQVSQKILELESNREVREKEENWSTIEENVNRLTSLFKLGNEYDNNFHSSFL